VRIGEGGEEWGGGVGADGKADGRGWRTVETTRRGEEGGGVRYPLHNPPSVTLPAGCTGPLAPTAGPDPASWPTPSILALPPLPLGGAGGHALSMVPNYHIKYTQESKNAGPITSVQRPCMRIIV